MTEKVDKKEANNEYNESVEMEIIQVLDKIRPFLQRDGGDCRLVKYEDGVVFLKVYGACAGCMILSQDLEEGVASILKEEIPEVVKVVNVDDLEDNPANDNDIEIN